MADELGDHVLHEVWRQVAPGQAVGTPWQRRARRCRGVPLRHHALGLHRPQHDLPASAGGRRVGERVVSRGVLDDGGQERSLGQGEPSCARTEERAGRHLDAVGALAEVDGVQVVGQDLVFGPAFLELVGEHCLAELARQGVGRALVLRQVGVLDELLGDGRAALHRVRRRRGRWLRARRIEA